MDAVNLNRSRKTQLILLLYELSYNLNQIIQTDLISLDFVSFVTVPYIEDCYINKPCWHGIQGNIHAHLHNIIPDR